MAGCNHAVSVFVANSVSREAAMVGNGSCCSDGWHGIAVCRGLLAVVATTLVSEVIGPELGIRHVPVWIVTVR